MWLVIPVKNFADAKQRLREYLDQSERAELYRCMLEDVLDCVCQLDELDGMALVTLDSTAAALADKYGMRIISEPANRGHTEAVQYGIEMLMNEGVGEIITLPGDIPLATHSELQSLIESHNNLGLSQAFSIVPSHDYGGSNAVICSPPNVVPLKFGTDSYFPHLQKAKATGIEPNVVPLPGISLDIDTIDDLRAFISEKSVTRTSRYLNQSGILARVQNQDPIGFAQDHHAT